MSKQPDFACWFPSWRGQTEMSIFPSYYVWRTNSGAKFLCLFNQPSFLEETQEKATQFSENLQFLWAENNPASKACHFISQRVSETPSSANRVWFFVFTWACVRVCIWQSVPQEVCCNKKNTLSSTPDEESKWLLSPFFTMLIEEPRYVPVLLSAGKGVSTFATVSLYACAFSCVCI